MRFIYVVEPKADRGHHAQGCCLALLAYRTKYRVPISLGDLVVTGGHTSKPGAMSSFISLEHSITYVAF